VLEDSPRRSQDFTAKPPQSPPKAAPKPRPNLAHASAEKTAEPVNRAIFKPSVGASPGQTTSRLGEPQWNLLLRSLMLGSLVA